jgi:uncharacterized protein YbjT (DUF2867 family)
MTERMVLVTGATGNTGSGVVSGLLRDGSHVRALVRSAEKGAGLKEQGAELAIGDLDDATSLSADIFEGVTDVYFCTWNGPTALDHWRHFHAALQSAGTTPRIVRLSAFGAPESRIIQQLAEAEQDLKDSGLGWTILQPTFFMQNTMMTAQTVKDQGAIYFDWGEGRAGMIDVRDIVDSALGVLTAVDDRFDGQSFVLTGPEAIGKDVQYVRVPHYASKEALLGMGIPEWIVDGFVELSIGFENNFANTTTDGVETLAGHAPRSFRQFAADFRGVWEG